MSSRGLAILVKSKKISVKLVFRSASAVILGIILVSLGSNISAEPVVEKPPISWRGPNGSQLAFDSYEAIEHFLSTAKVISAKELSSGVTRPFRITLEADGIRMKAIFRYLEDFKQRWESPKGLKLNYHDSFEFELAAYRLNRILGMDHIPPTVKRKLRREDFINSKLMREFPSLEGTIQAWVEDAMTEKYRHEEGIIPPHGKYWAYQFQLMTLFDNLIFNDDRNQGNILIGPDWKLWFIDSSRAFRTYRDLSHPDDVRMCDREVWERLRTVTDSELKSALGELLNDSEMRTLLIRREKLVERIEDLIAERGENRVLFDLHSADPRLQSVVKMVSASAF